MAEQRLTAFVTGGASGIGLATAAELMRRHWDVVIADRDPRAIAAAGDALGAMTERLLAVCCDVADEADVRDAFARGQDRFGPIRGVVHAAGIGLEAPFLDTSLEAFKRIVEVNLTGTFIVGQTAARHMRDHGGGAIVNIASTSGLIGNAGRSAYGASKGGVVTLTKVMAVELAAHNIRVNAVAPGPIETPMVTAMHSPETRAALMRTIPQRRYGTPEEIACVIATLLDDAQMGYCTGQTIAIDGGFMAAGLMAMDSSGAGKT